MECYRCVLCGSNLDKCKKIRLISGDKSCHVLSTATKLLYDCVPSDMTISSSVVQGILSGTGNMAYICKRSCYTQLEKIQKELEEVKKNMREKKNGYTQGRTEEESSACSI